jgi:hypothetical protein
VHIMSQRRVMTDPREAIVRNLLRPPSGPPASNSERRLGAPILELRRWARLSKVLVKCCKIPAGIVCCLLILGGVKSELKDSPLTSRCH